MDVGVQSIVFIDPNPDPDTPSLASVVEHARGDADRQVRPVVTIHAEGTSEVLVPGDCDETQIASLVDGQAVVGPVTALAEAVESVRLTRDAADLLRHGVVVDPRAVVPYEDLLGPLLLSRERLVTDLLVTKHLRPLEGLSARRRVVLGELMLTVLERGGPVNQLARDRGTSPQTDHSRLIILREMFGDKLDDPDQRFELIVALRTALPQWRAAAQAKRR